MNHGLPSQEHKTAGWQSLLLPSEAWRLPPRRGLDGLPVLKEMRSE